MDIGTNSIVRGALELAIEFNSRRSFQERANQRNSGGRVYQRNTAGLSPEEAQTVRRLKSIDAKVRAHERAHANVGGPYAGAPSTTLQRGPDGQQYAVAGEVKIDIAPIRNNPEATIRKMDIVARAALAPADPSDADRQIAARARQIKLLAQNELARQNLDNNVRLRDLNIAPQGESTLDARTNQVISLYEFAIARSPAPAQIFDLVS